MSLDSNGLIASPERGSAERSEAIGLVTADAAGFRECLYAAMFVGGDPSDPFGATFPFKGNFAFGKVIRSGFAGRMAFGTDIAL